MPYKSGAWGEDAKERAKRRRDYFREWMRNNRNSVEGLGYLGELEGLELLVGSERKTSGIDLEFNGKKIEVKTSSLRYCRHRQRYWGFKVLPQIGKCDFFLFLCKGEESDTKYIILIPSNEIKAKTQVRIAEAAIRKYEKYFVSRGIWGSTSQ